MMEAGEKALEACCMHQIVCVCVCVSPGVPDFVNTCVYACGGQVEHGIFLSLFLWTETLPEPGAQ